MQTVIESLSNWLAADALFLDTETTGLDEDAQIIEIAILDRHGNPLIDTLVRPTVEIPADAMAIHGITNEMVANAPAWPEIHSQVGAVLHGREVIAYNAAFDVRLLEQDARRHKMTPPSFVPRCAMEASLRVAGLWATGKTFERLETALSRVGALRQGTAHRAKDDCLSTLQLVEAIVGRDRLAYAA
jgi:DNA polymerase III epsilon subunit-like protein